MPLQVTDPLSFLSWNILRVLPADLYKKHGGVTFKDMWGPRTERIGGGTHRKKTRWGWGGGVGDREQQSLGLDWDTDLT